MPTSVSDAVRLRAAVEHAWHALLAGEPREAVLRASEVGEERKEKNCDQEG